MAVTEHGLMTKVTLSVGMPGPDATHVACPGLIAAPGALAIRSGSPGRDSLTSVPATVSDQNGSVPMAVIGWLKSEDAGADAMIRLAASAHVGLAN